VAVAGLQGRLGAMRLYFHSAMGLILAAAAAYVVAGETKTAGRPNIVLIMADDMGFSGIGCYGSETPVVVQARYPPQSGGFLAVRV